MKNNIISVLIVLTIVGTLTGCPDDATESNKTTITGVTISPPTATVAPGGNLTFSATVTGANNPPQSVKWTVSGGGTGTSIPSGTLYVGANETATSLIVTATSMADATKFGTASVTVSNISVVIDPPSATVAPGSTQQFTATVYGNNNPPQSVTWAVTGGGNSTSISSSGLLSVAAGETATSLTVTATSTVDTTKSATAPVTVSTQPPTNATVTIYPTTAVAKGRAQQFIAVVEGDDNPAQTVTWTVTGGGSGTSINASSGLLSVGANEPAASLIVRATSTVDATKIGTTTVVVTTHTTWTVSNLSTWITAVDGVRDGGDNQYHLITFSADVTTFANDGKTFGSVTGTTVYIDGNNRTLSMPSSSSGHLEVGGLKSYETFPFEYYRQTVIIKDLTLQGRNDNTNSFGLVQIDTGGTFSMEGSASLTGNKATIAGGGVYNSGGAFLMKDYASITDNIVGTGGGGVNVASGVFIMQDNAEVSDNTVTSSSVNGYAYGGGVRVLNGTFIMRDNAAVKDNIATVTASVYYPQGGGVFVNGGTFHMEGGVVSGNTASGGNYGDAYGGGVYIGNMGGGSGNGGFFALYNGEISNNEAIGKAVAEGGGVYGLFTMEGGAITGNSVSASNTTSSGYVEARGGGVSGNLTMKGGTIANNAVTGGRTYGSSMVWASGGGVYGPLTMSGGVISGNTVTATNSGNSNNITVYGGGVCTSNLSKTGGTIHGNDAAGTLKNTTDGNKGHAVYNDSSTSNPRWRNATAGPTANSSSAGFWLSETDD